jgi:GT2 family glycosyltransferase
MVEANRVDLSILVVNYNTCDYLKKCIDSIFNNFLPLSIEVIVIDNASRDNSVEMLSTSFPNIKLIENKTNLGFASANNQGIDIALGRYILLLNPDTEILPNTLPEMVNYLDKNNEVGALGCLVLDSNGNPSSTPHVLPGLGIAFAHAFCIKKIVSPILFSNDRIKSNLEKLLGNYFGEIRKSGKIPYPVDSVSGCCMMVRKDVIDEIGYLDENLFLDFEDVDLCHRILKTGWQIYYHPGISIIHHWEKARETNFNTSFIAKYNSMLYFYYKAYGYSTYLLLRLILVIAFSLRLFLTVIRRLFSKNNIGKSNEKLAAYLKVISLCFNPKEIKLKIDSII